MACLSKTIGKFTLDSYSIIVKDAPGEDVFFSPVNVAIAMAMVELGARGKTREEISKVMHFGFPGNTSKGGASHESCKAADIHTEFKELLSTITTCKTLYDLNLANGLFGQKGFAYEKKYLTDTEKFYNAKLEEVDFKNDTEEARQTINAWVEKQTNGKIKNLFVKDSISSATVLVLACAIHFKGKWKFPFRKENTVDDTFHLNTNETKSVKMMTQTGKFKMNTLADMKCKLIELPYEKDVSMLILLPDEINGLEKIESNMTYDKVEALLTTGNLSEVLVHLRIPKWHAEHLYDFIKVFRSLGINDLFTDQANLTGISTEAPLKVAKIIHKAFVNVDELGTEAAAATGVGMVATSLPIIAEFYARHPFLYVIKHNPTNTILFKGRCSNPKI